MNPTISGTANSQALSDLTDNPLGNFLDWPAVVGWSQFPNRTMLLEHFDPNGPSRARNASHNVAHGIISQLAKRGKFGEDADPFFWTARPSLDLPGGISY
jgi:hypothetical protein